MFTPSNRFHLVNKLIEIFPEKREAGITPELEKLNHDSVFLMWDAFKIVIVDQKLASTSHKFVKANSKHGRSSKQGIGISRETVYIGECLEWLNKMRTFDAGLLDDVHGDKPKYSNKELEGGFLPVQMNFGDGKNDENLGSDSTQDWVDESDDDTADQSLEDRIAEKVVKRLTAVIDSKLKPFSKLFDRVKKLEDDFEGIRNHVSNHKTELEKNVNKKLQQLDVANIVAKQEEIDQQLEKLRKAKDEFDLNLNDVNKLKDKVRSKKSSTSTTNPSRFHVWGRNTADSGAPAIPRVFNFAVSKIPNKDDYSTAWFKENQQKIFDRRNLKANIIEVEQIKATFPNARTKTFKVLVMTEDMEVNIENFLEQRLWTGGLSISKYKKPRFPRPDLVASNGLEN